MSQSTSTITNSPQLSLPTAADVAMLAAERHSMCLSWSPTTARRRSTSSLAPARRIAAVVRTGNANTPMADLEQAGRAALAEHIRDRAAAALDTVAVRLAHGRAVTGLAAAWEAIDRSDPDLLVVEHTHQAAARLSEDGLDLVDDPEELGVLDDAVDELIEAALARGVEVVTVPDGALARHGRLVLALRGPVPALVS